MMAMELSNHLVSRFSPAGLALAILIHGAAFWGLVKMERPRTKLPEPELLKVELLKPTAVDLPKPELYRPARQPLPKRPTPTPARANTLAASATDFSALQTATPIEPQTAAYEPATPQTASATSMVSQREPQIVNPRFDADYLENPRPAYPPLARRMGEEGKVVLRVLVSPEGLPIEISLHASSGSERLDRAAQEAVQRWKFIPARQGEVAVAASVLVPIIFSLRK
ncbi:MAG: TonB family protein [Rhodocyclaceae bacterium]|nr:TonB family protein [Rhodocyclaceae bacterium]